MDFSSKERALQSLERRQPELSDSILEKGRKVQEIFGDGGRGGWEVINTDKNMEFLCLIMNLIKEESRWEAVAVGLYLAQEYLESILALEDINKGEVYTDGPRLPSLREDSNVNNNNSNYHKLDEETKEYIMEGMLRSVLSNLEHDEPRIRSLVAKILGSYSRLQWLSDACRSEIYERTSRSLYEHLEKGRGDLGVKAVDDTTGWRAMESSLFALASFFDVAMTLEKSGPAPSLHSTLLPFLSQSQQQIECEKLLQVVEASCVDHINRHVRAAGLSALDRIVRNCPPRLLTEDPILFALLNNTINISLADNWSQVRMAGSVVCRTLFITVLPEQRSQFYPKLLPRMCLNRFYLAQGVKLYSHDTWKLVLGDEGLMQVAQNIGPIVRYYIKMADADNHVVREAACQAIAELATKVGTHESHANLLEPFVHALLQALLMCFYDESWPVRDEACLACGLFVKAYPAYCKQDPDTLKELISLWFLNLMDPIWSVREDAAISLANALSAFSNQSDTHLLIDPILALLDERLPKAKDQAAMTQTQYLEMQNDIDKHTNNQLYSCGSLAPKLKKGKQKKHIGGCSDCIVDRPPHAWEMTDGCLYLLRELFLLQINDHELLSESQQIHYLLLAFKVCDEARHFPQSDDLRQTLWRVLSPICNALGKKFVKQKLLHLFLPMLVQNVTSKSSSSLSKHAANHCIVDMASLVGKGILLGRIEYDYDRDFVSRILDDIQYAPTSCGSADITDSFSPFGPTIVQ